MSKTLREFGPRLKRLREARDLSLAELARLLGIDYMQVYRYEKGLNLPAVETAVRLAQILQVSTDELLTGSERSSPPKIKSVRLFERMRMLDELPKDKQELALQILDGVIAQHEMQSLTERLRRS
ncbi:MAG TPA: helix-turn-helix transcriptional regulator [Thermoanaerobaculia bacterium]|nr:helix-turn-helix transcriptional regulator [Thermoanaerobaculia bacterium]